ncbi:hypothetical protein TRVL_03443 [Trypanosoma vivax]|nr:hypothetical protein TRVL_03443 [Trypanosoma vivax]
MVGGPCIPRWYIREAEIDCRVLFGKQRCLEMDLSLIQPEQCGFRGVGGPAHVEERKAGESDACLELRIEVFRLAVECGAPFLKLLLTMHCVACVARDVSPHVVREPKY